jgi:hypothetical protein
VTPLTNFLTMVRGRLPGCPEQVQQDGVLAACIEFCNRTHLLIEAVTVDVVAGEPRCDLSPDSDTAWEVLNLRRSTESLVPMDRIEFIDQHLDTRVGLPECYYLEGDGQLVLGPVPDTAETLTATVTLRPKDTATRVHDALYRDHRQAICAGARAWVRRHYGEWSEPRLEAEDRSLFERAVHNQTIRRARGGVNASLRVRSNDF